jgi:hypothetical protein
VNITKVVVFFTTNPTKLSLQFFEISTIFYAFYKFLQTANTIEVSFCAEAPGSFCRFTTIPLLHKKHPRKITNLAMSSPGTGRRRSGQIPANWRPGAGGGGPEGSGASISPGVRSGGGASGVAQRMRLVLVAVPPFSGEVEPRQRLRAGVELRLGLEEAPGW